MSRATVGIVMMIAGAALVVGGLAAFVLRDRAGADVELALGSQDSATSQSTSAPASNATTSIAPQTTTTSSMVTTTSSTTTTSTTTTASTTTTSVAPLPPDDLIRAFVPVFAEWIADGDVDALMASLHPVVIAEWGEELCTAFVEREILALGDYRLTGDPTGPVPTTIGSTVVDIHTGPVAFTFQGAEFDDEATFAVERGAVRWFATCR